jgi:hypothetical protein
MDRGYDPRRGRQDGRPGLGTKGRCGAPNGNRARRAGRLPQAPAFRPVDPQPGRTGSGGEAGQEGARRAITGPDECPQRTIYRFIGPPAAGKKRIVTNIWGRNHTIASQCRIRPRDRKNRRSDSLDTVRNRTSICCTMGTVSHGLRCLTNPTRSSGTRGLANAPPSDRGDRDVHPGRGDPDSGGAFP